MRENFIEFKHKGDLLEAFYAYPETEFSNNAPLVLIAHAWAGRDEFAVETARQLASKGYIAFAMDLYGKNKIGKTVEEKTALMEPFMKDRKFLHERLLCNMEQAISLDAVDTEKVSGIGFCFGGLCVLDLARIGANLKGAVSFHGLLNAPQQVTYEEITSKILVLHGSDDPMVSFDDIENFKNEMNQHEADWQINIYGNTKHGFSVPGANDLKLGVVYNSQATKRAWFETYNFFDELFL